MPHLRTSDDLQIAYDDTGSGDAVILIHGMGASRTHFDDTRAGLLDAGPGEWLVSYLPVVYGTVELPEEGEPVVCFVVSADGRKVTPEPCILQHLTGNTWLNCFDGTVFDFEDGEVVVPLSGVSRTAGRLEVRRWD